MKRKLAKMTAMAMSVMMALSLAACGGGSGSGDGSSSGGSSGSGDSDKTITFWNVGTEGVDLGTYEMIIEKFNENNEDGWTIENVPTQNDKYKEKLVIAMSSGECPDMYTSWSGGPMNEYIDSGYAQPLDDLYEEYGLKDIYMPDIFKDTERLSDKARIEKTA